MSKRWKVSLSVISALVLSSLLLGAIDFKRIDNERIPIFTFSETSYQDGGTRVFYGLGYKLIYWHRISFEEEGTYYYVGPEFKWGPWMISSLPEEIEKEGLERYDESDPQKPWLD